MMSGERAFYAHQHGWEIGSLLVFAGQEYDVDFPPSPKTEDEWVEYVCLLGVMEGIDKARNIVFREGKGSDEQRGMAAERLARIAPNWPEFDFDGSRLKECVKFWARDER